VHAGREHMELDGDGLQTRFNKRFLSISLKNSRSEATLLLVIEAGVILANGVAAALALQLSWLIFVPVYAVAIFVIGMRQRCIGNIIHECSHAAFVTDRKWNEAIGLMLSILLFYSFNSYRQNHMTHHRYTGDYERDRDFVDTAKFGFHNRLTLTRWKQHLRRLLGPEVLSAYIGRTIYVTTETLPWRLARLGYIALLVAAVIATVWESSIGLFVLAFWIVPLLMTLPVIGYLSDIMDHGGLIWNEIDVEKSRNYIVKNQMIMWMFFPRNDSYHLLHHLFPAVATRSLPECHAILMAESHDYAQRKHSFAEWWRDFRIADLCEPQTPT
jgi:fatty acid desaturase